MNVQQAKNNVDREVRIQFPGPNNAGLRKMIRDCYAKGGDVASIAKQVALTASGERGLKAVVKVVNEVREEMAKASDRLLIDLAFGGQYR